MSFRIYTIDEIISYARKNSKYYAELYKDLPENVSLEDLPLVDQEHFWAHCDMNGGTVATRPQLDGQVLKSGGTTGNPKYSLYTAEEWETMCECSAAVLHKGGLTNGTKVANLFYAGGLYASFLYMYSMLYFASAKTIMYNLSGNISIEDIVHTVHEHKINCIAGLPSMLTKIVSYIEENQMTDFAVDTIYFAGETLYPDQREKISRVFGRKIDFRSVFYASNDGGPIGYFTEDCGYNEHRVLSNLTKMELIDPDTGEIITEMNKPGIIYITSLFKTLTPIIRYPAGDMGVYTEPEGNPDRKFKMLGRSNVAARAGYATLYPKDLGDVLKMCGIEFYSYQIIVERNRMDQFIFKIAVPDTKIPDTEKFIKTLFRERTLLQDALDTDTMEMPKVEWCRPEDLEYNPRTGKLKIVIDRRI